ncbi:hypothetical protein [Chloroflexus sp.]|uniref:hypothetical protein n=1 Tax=Chloroflexus sp. TaxID=1904827 RepID=UPI0026288247|nr:hypothetical protein [uncultured Chloroflexus sp.]
MASRRRPGAPADFEEIRPNLFLIHNPALGPVLRGEGEREGFHFRLTGWRRAGLLGRLASRGFVTLTIPDRIAALPAPPITTLGPARTITVGAKQQLSLLDLSARGGWQPIPTSDKGTVTLREGQIVRRRRGRGPAEYLRITAAGWEIVPADHAILIAYGQLTSRPFLKIATTPDGWILPDFPLPKEYRQVLGQIALPHTEGWLLSGELEREMATALLAKLGVTIG